MAWGGKLGLDGYWDRLDASASFVDAKLSPELPYDEFIKLDDNSLMERILKLSPTHLEYFRRAARLLLLNDTFDYECRVLKRGVIDATPRRIGDGQLPAKLFFDLLSDYGHHQLYTPGSVLVRQALTSHIDATKLLKLEESAGAFSPLFRGDNNAVLVPNGYYVFLPRDASGSDWDRVRDSIADGSLFGQIEWEDARRNQVCPSDTWNAEKYPDFENELAIGISYCEPDYPTVVRIIRELCRLKRRYRIHLTDVDGAGVPSLKNSIEIITKAGAALAVISTEYLRRALDTKTHISREVRAMHDCAAEKPMAVLGVEARAKLSAVPNWNWSVMNEAWHGMEPVLANAEPLAIATEERLREYVRNALKSIDEWKAE